MHSACAQQDVTKTLVRGDTGSEAAESGGLWTQSTYTRLHQALSGADKPWSLKHNDQPETNSGACGAACIIMCMLSGLIPFLLHLALGTCVQCAVVSCHERAAAAANHYRGANQPCFSVQVTMPQHGNPWCRFNRLNLHCRRRHLSLFTLRVHTSLT